MGEQLLMATEALNNILKVRIERMCGELVELDECLMQLDSVLARICTKCHQSD